MIGNKLSLMLLLNCLLFSFSLAAVQPLESPFFLPPAFILLALLTSQVPPYCSGARAGRALQYRHRRKYSKILVRKSNVYLDQSKPQNFVFVKVCVLSIPGFFSIWLSFLIFVFVDRKVKHHNSAFFSLENKWVQPSFIFTWMNAAKYGKGLCTSVHNVFRCHYARSEMTSVFI